jgi:hypothetical protein
MIRCWKTEICCIRLLHLRNIHGKIMVKYSPPHSRHKLLYWFCHWRIMVSSICLNNKTFFIILLFHEYWILHNPCPVLSQGNMVSLIMSIEHLPCFTGPVFRLPAAADGVAVLCPTVPSLMALLAAALVRDLPPAPAEFELRVAGNLYSFASVCTTRHAPHMTCFYHFHVSHLTPVVTCD